VILYGTKAKVILRETIWGMQQKDLGELLMDGDSVNLRMTFPTDNPVFSRMAGEIEAFNKWILDDIEPSISGRNGFQMVKIANAILESSRHGKAVKISG
jgi:predicted dehydrogenase